MDYKTGIPKELNIDFNFFYKAIVKSTNDYIYVVDMKTDIALISENMRHDFGFSKRLISGLIPLWGELIHERDKNRYYDSIDQMVQGNTDEHNVEYQIQNYKNEYIWVLCRGYLKRDENGNPLTFAGIVTNLSEYGRIDSVTGLFTKSECERNIDHLLNTKSKAGILLLGLDDFSSINNRRNHTFGDSALRQYAQEIQRLLPQEATIYRFDGDEFAIIYKNASREKLKNLYEMIHSYGNKPHILDGFTYYCSISAGIALLGEDGDNYADLIKYVTNALEASKQKGKNTYTFFTCDLILTKLHSIEMIDQLRESVLKNMEGFSVVYQPLTYAQDLKIIGAEALLRWSSKSLGKIGPNEFIPLLESSGLIIPVGKWVLEQAAAQCKQWISYCESIVMNVNVSYLQMLDSSFVPMVIEILKKYELNPNHIVLELTESRFVTDMDILKDVFERLRDSDIRFAMDDFGTGYSSLGVLSKTPADIVKIDRVFISEINQEECQFNRSFIGAVINLCHSVGISVCVEGVEYQEELETVRNLDADCIQGYYISKPIEAAEFQKKYWENE